VWPDGSIHWISSHGRVHFDGEGDQRRAVRFVGANRDITERMRAEEALRLSETRYRLLFESNMDAIFLTRQGGKVIAANPAACAMFGATEEEFLHMGRQWTTDPEDPRLALALAERERTGKFKGELTYIRRDGTKFLGELSSVILPGDESYFAVLRDITERKRAEARLRRFYEADLFAILYWSLDGGVIDVNDSFLKMTGYTREDVHAGLLNWAKMTPPEYHALDEDARRQIRETGVHLPYEKEFIRKDGARVWGLFSAAAWEDNRNEGVSFILDITKRKRAEEALRASEQRWATTLRSIGDAVISTNATGKIEFMNDVAQKLTGWSMPEAKGLDMNAIFNIVHETTRVKPESPVAKVIRLGKVVGLANHTALIRPDGTEIAIEDSAAPIRDKTGQIEGIVLVFRDVSDQRKTEKVLRDNDRLATTGRLAATIAHEIHNPLDAVGNLLFLIAQGTAEDGTREYASMASRELARTTQMTQQMLTFQREAAKPIPVNIGQILESVVALFERKIKLAGISLEQQISFDGQILALPGELRQIFANLVGNAIEAVGPRPGTITVRAYSSHDRRCEKPGLRIVIADDGRGIPADVRNRIFEPFFTTKGESGTGLGLWISSGILRKYDGTIKLKSSTQPGRSGTCFSVFLPL
jgi:PAS domain S-box-containing protein